MEDTMHKQSNQEDWNLFLSNKEAAYFNTRVSRYSPRYPFLERRTNSSERVQSRYNLKKKLLIDEEMVHTKTMINENKAVIGAFFGKSLPAEQYAQAKKSVCKAEQLYKHTQVQLKHYQWRIKKQERNYSQPKYKPGPRHKDLPKKRKYLPNSLKSRHYFLGHWQELEQFIIQIKCSKAQELNLLQQSRQTEDVLSFSNQLWRSIIASLKMLRRYAEFDIFSSKIMIKSLKQYHMFLAQQQNHFISALFQNELAYRARGMEEKAIIKLRVAQLKKHGESIGIKIDDESSLNINKIYYNFKPLENRLCSYYYKQFLIKVFEIRKVESAGAGGKYYSVEYYIGLQKKFEEEELQKAHPKEFQRFLIR